MDWRVTFAEWLRMGAAFLERQSDKLSPPAVEAVAVVEPVAVSAAQAVAPLAHETALMILARQIVAELELTAPPARLKPRAYARWRFLMAVRALREAFPDERARAIHLAIEQAVSNR